MKNTATTEKTLPEAAVSALKEIFGFRSFRPNQREIVQAILDRRDAFVVMPTGGGKSLCYQLPAFVMSGTCLVISPLISLMKDQVDAAVEMGLRAAYLNSSLSASQRRDVEGRLMAGNLDLLYVSPERFAMTEFIAAMKRVKLSFVAIDEAHCISEWGHDFRPEYLNLSTILKEFAGVPVTAFTATQKVQDDIVAKLDLRAPHVIRASFNRPNLFYKVLPKDKPDDQILRFVRTHIDEPGIVYRTTRKSVEQTADMLNQHGIKTLPYHAGLDDATRIRNQDAFNRDEVDVIVATVAFGMGIDKSNVRYVLHGDLPKNVESYYQETGRAGRDGEPAHCLLLFGNGDIPKITFFINQISDFDERVRTLGCLQDMIQYATLHACRRKQLLNYFGEVYPNAEDFPKLNHAAPTPQTGTTTACCDICDGEVASIDATQDAQIIMSAVARTGQRFGIVHIVNVVMGVESPRIKELGHDQIKTFGIGREHDKRHWRLIVDNLLAQGLIHQSRGDYPVLELSPESDSVLFKGRKVLVLKALRQASPSRPSRRKTSSATDGYNDELFEKLRELRKKLATAQGVPPYVVFNDRTLHEMAKVMPATKTAMLQITGVGETKIARYGEPFLAAVKSFLATKGPSR